MALSQTLRCTRLALPLLAALVVLGAATKTRADADDARARWQARVSEARRLYEAGDPNAALTKLQDAYAILPSPMTHFNFGLVYQGLARHVDALDSFERFLEEATDASPGKREDALRYVNELRERVLTVDVTTDAAGAEVLVDDHLRGTTPLRPIHLLPGPHLVVVRKAGLPTTYRKRIDGKGGERIPLLVRLIPAPTSAAAPSPAPAAVLGTPASPQVSPAAEPLYRRWWFWTSIAVVAAGAATGMVIAADRRQGWSCGSQCNAGTESVRP